MLTLTCEMSFLPYCFHFLCMSNIIDNKVKYKDLTNNIAFCC